MTTPTRRQRPTSTSPSRLCPSRSSKADHPTTNEPTTKSCERGTLSMGWASGPKSMGERSLSIARRVRANRREPRNTTTSMATESTPPSETRAPVAKPLPRSETCQRTTLTCGTEARRQSTPWASWAECTTTSCPTSRPKPSQTFCSDNASCCGTDPAPRACTFSESKGRPETRSKNTFGSRSAETR